MTLEQFQQMIADGLPLEGEEMIEFMREQSDESRRVQMELNTRYHTPDEIRLVNETIEALDRLGYSINNDVPGYLGLSQVELSHALKVLTGLTLTEIKHLLLPLRLDALRSSHPDLNPDQLAHRLGFADRTALFRIIGRDEYDRKLAKHGKRDV